MFAVILKNKTHEILLCVYQKNVILSVCVRHALVLTSQNCENSPQLMKNENNNSPEPHARPDLKHLTFPPLNVGVFPILNQSKAKVTRVASPCCRMAAWFASRCKKTPTPSFLQKPQAKTNISPCSHAAGAVDGRGASDSFR